MRKIYFIPNKKTDIIVVDVSNKHKIESCIPVNLSRTFLDVHSAIPLIPNIDFFLHLLKRIFSFGLTSKALLSAIIDTVNAKIILTFIDNNSVMGELDLIYPDKLIVSIQNGIRMRTIDSLGFNRHDRAPVFFGFGEQQKDLMIANQVSYRKYFSVGSLKTGLFLAGCESQSRSKEANLCFISQYIKKWDNSRNPGYRDYNLIVRESANNSIKWCNNRNFKVNIAMRSPINSKKYQEELNFFSNEDTHYDHVTFHENNPDVFSSYKVAYNSSIIVCVDSTLGFEMFGLGVKVLFCSGVLDNRYIVKEGLSELHSKIPSFNIVEDLESSLFFEKLNYLNNMDTNDYLDRTKSSREYFMKYDNLRPAHKVISEYIEKFHNKKL